MKGQAGLFTLLLAVSLAAQAEAPCPTLCKAEVKTQKIPLTSIESTPACHQRQGEESNEEIVKKNKMTDFEVLARLVFAEGISTNMEKCGKYGASLFESLAWGVQNRVALAAVDERYARQFGKGLHGVIFKRAQFNPAVSKKSSYSKLFLCPTEHPEWKKYWSLAAKAADKVVTTPGENPFLKAGPQKKGTSGVTHFYYPQSTEATQPPVEWADLSKKQAQKAYVESVMIEGTRYSNECVQFFAY